MQTADSILYYPLGDSAIVIALSDGIAATTQSYISNLGKLLDRNPIQGLIEYVPAFTSLTIFYNPVITTYNTVELQLKQLLNRMDITQMATPPAVIEIPVLYGGAVGPDLEIVAQHAGLSHEEVIALHTAPSYLVYMIGFAPGFPYLGGLHKKIACPRKAVPRAAIPAGSVGIAGTQTGIYPIGTPGGWQIIGQTPLQLFDVNNHPPTLIQAGNQLRFVAITEKEFLAMKRPYKNLTHRGMDMGHSSRPK